ncbi:MAG: hypothetical protein QNJ94_22340 [Alphaproteobacteria bacterium]|nr:hypothetical protein [Alphaproteobacteria bacterium]
MTQNGIVHCSAPTNYDGRRQRRYTAAFFATLLGLLTICVIATQRLYYFRETPIDFYALNEDTIVISHGLTRKQRASLKVGFAENFAPPQVGLFGNHQFKYLTRNVFPKGSDKRYFFNFWYANLALPELRDYIAHLASIDKLPTRLVIVQITTPNNDNGSYILGYNGELPSDLVMADASAGGTDLIGRLGHLFSEWANELYTSFRYSSVLVGIVGSRPEERMLERHACADTSDFQKAAAHPILLKLPVMVRLPLLPADPRKYCDPSVFWSFALQADGSYDVKYHNLGRPIRNENQLDPGRRQLKFGDDRRIAALMRQIADVVQAAGRQVAFVVPPVYETDRFSSVDRVFDEALALVPDIPVLDHRRHRDKKGFFVNYDHPSEAYFRFMVEDLAARALLP